VRPKLRVGAQIPVQTSLHGGQERGNFLLHRGNFLLHRGNFLLHGMARIHLSTPKITLCATYVLKIPWKDNFGMERQKSST
jgi:hypothetical protein